MAHHGDIWMYIELQGPNCNKINFSEQIEILLKVQSKQIKFTQIKDQLSYHNKAVEYSTDQLMNKSKIWNFSIFLNRPLSFAKRIQG